MLLLFVHYRFPSPEYYIDVPVDNPIICNATMDLGYEDNVLDMSGRNVYDYISLGYFRGYNSFIDPYCICLEDLSRKVMWTTVFNHSYDFSKAFDKVKRMLIVFSVILVIASYLIFSKLWSQEFDKLLHVLTASNLTSQVLKL